MKHRTPSLSGKIRHRSKAFTLIELLIVIGIILLLIGILIPTVSKVRISVQTVSTRQMISRLEAGINTYFTDFGAYPGTFANSQVNPITGGPSTTIGTGALAQAPITSTENLYLALAGGLGVTTNGASPPVVNGFTYTASLGQNLNGPGNLNPANLKRFSPYISVTANETSYPASANVAQQSNQQGQWCVAGTAPFVGDTIVPEFLDKYARPSPILYMRANRGASGFTTYALDFATGSQFQYQPVVITNTYCNSVGTQGTVWSPDTTAYPVVKDSSGNVLFNQGFDSYIGNATNSRVGSLLPYQKDGYILISAGPDGKYGTGDDITNFRQ